MKKILSVILALTLILALSGCKKTNNTSSESELSSEPIISSNEEDVISIEDNSSETTVVNSSEESKINSSTVTPSTNVNSKVNSNETTVSTNNSSQTTVENKPTTYFEKMHLKTITLNDNYCLNTETHECVNISCGIEQREIKSGNDVWANIPENEKNKYLYVDAIFNSHCGANTIIAFDKYTGMILNSCLDNAKYFNSNGKEILAFQTWGGGGYGYRTCNTIIPQNYDGLMFLVTNSYIELYELASKTLYLDDIIDLKNEKYYIFAANSSR